MGCGVRRSVAVGLAVAHATPLRLHLQAQHRLVASRSAAHHQADGSGDPGQWRGTDGPVSWLAYAFRFMQLPLGLFGVAIATATLPSISRSAASGNFDEFRRTLSRSLGMVFLL